MKLLLNEPVITSSVDGSLQYSIAAIAVDTAMRLEIRQVFSATITPEEPNPAARLGEQIEAWFAGVNKSVEILPAAADVAADVSADIDSRTKARAEPIPVEEPMEIR